MAIVISIIGIVFVFSLVTFVHEFGHFFMAKRSGVKVDEFAFGIPPRIWSIKKGETSYSINAIPIGGYVKLHGDDGSDEKDKRSYAAKPPHVRTGILLAGVTLNFVLAWLILAGGYTVGMSPILPDMANHKGVVNNLQTVVTEVKSGSPAEKSGIKKGDTIEQINGQKINTFTQMRLVIEAEAVKDAKKPLNVTILRDGKTLNKKVATYKEKAKIGKREVEGVYVGVGVHDKGKISAPFFTAIRVSLEEVWGITVLTLAAVLDLFRKIFLMFQVPDDVSGPVGIFVITGTFAQLGFSPLIQFAAIFSIAVAVFNLIPIPALDGGQVLILAVETLVRKKLSMKARNTIQITSFGLLILLMIVVTFKDVFTFGIIK